jgi:uncharacterized protein YecT (DUF1311 family)
MTNRPSTQKRYQMGRIHRIAKVVILAILICFGWIPTARAQVKGSSNCGDLSQQSMNACFADGARNATNRMQQLIAELKTSLTADAFTRLFAVQTKWLDYRDNQCKWQASFFEGGSMQPTVYWSCVESATWTRIDELKYQLCEGGGMTGSCERSQHYDPLLR